MPTLFRDKTHLWMVWHRGKKMSDVREVLGLYVFKDQAMTQAERAMADGVTPVRDLVLANALKLTLGHLMDRRLSAAPAAASG